MRVLTSTEQQEAMKFFDAAAKVAGSSSCSRAHCGSVIVKDGNIVAEGFNSPPQNNPKFQTCFAEYDIPSGFRHDRTCCIHAEQRAIAEAVKNNTDLAGSRIYFVAIDENGNKIKAADLKCTICSRAVLDANIAEFALYCDDGIRVYDTTEFDQLSYQYKTPIKS